MTELGCMLFRIYFRPSSDTNKSTISQKIYQEKTNTCWLENNTKVLTLPDPQLAHKPFALTTSNLIGC